MTDEQKIKLVLDNADRCNYRLDVVLKKITNPELALSGGMAEWLRGIGIDDPRIAPTLDETLSPDARRSMFGNLMEKYHLTAAGVAEMLGCSASSIAAYRGGRLDIPIKRLMQLRRIIAAIDAAAAEPTDK